MTSARQLDLARKSGFRFVCALASLCLLFLGACGKKKEKVSAEELRPVKYMTLSYGNSALNRTYIGQSQAEKEINLSFRVTGKVASVLVKEGDKIRKGSLIATLDPRDLKLKLDQAKASRNQAKVQFSTSSSELDRIKDLYEKNTASLSDYEKAQNSYASAQAAYEESVKNVNLAERQLSYTRLYAPIDGVITKKSVDVNEVVQSGSTVVELSSEGFLQVRVGVPDSYIGQISVGEDASIVFSSIKGTSFKGRVAEISYSKSAGSTYPVNVDILDANSHVRIGMSARVTFKPEIGSNGSMSLYLPADAVTEGQSGETYVFVVREEGGVMVVKKTTVELGDLTNQGFLVLSGVKVGDKVVTAGITNLTDGMKVTLLKGAGA
ncbi:efflux RND transporter periplasmic adaptor subunit [Fulvitalea axinellae]